MSQKKYTFFLLLFLTSIATPFMSYCNDRIVYTEEGLIEEAFVTYATPNYFPILEVLLDSIEAFSSRPIVVFGVNGTVPFSEEKYPFMIKKRIDIESSSKESVFFTKPRVLLESGIARGIYVDADIILNAGFDILFEHTKRETAYPLCPQFPFEETRQQPLMDALGITIKSMPYVHAPLIIFSQHCTPFLEEWQSVNRSHGEFAACHDESVLNVLLWKYKINDYINLCDPYYTLVYDYLNGSTVYHHRHRYAEWIGKIDFLTFHGCKDAREARSILEKLIKKADSS